MVREHFYVVQGATPAELSNELHAKGPQDDGARRMAYTDVQLKYRWTSTPLARGCRPEDVHVDAEIVMTLPEWRSRSGAAAETLREWDRFFDAVQAHENGHVQIGVEMAGAIVAAINGLGTRESCDEVDREASRLGSQLIAQMKDRQHAFDRENEHGAKTGAVLSVH